MNISVEKTQASPVVHKKDTWLLKNLEIKINNTKIPAIDPDVTFRNLDSKMGPRDGVHCGIVVSEILSMVRRVRS